MNIEKEKLLSHLTMVKSGLSAREFIEQSNCFVFQDGQVITFNDEVSCRIKTDLKITGAVRADRLLAVLEKLEVPELDVSEEANSGEITFRYKNKSFGVLRDKEIFLAVDQVKQPKEWVPLPEGFAEAVRLVKSCVTQDESKELLTFIHITSKFMEACDNYQMMRVQLETPLEEPVLIRGTSLEGMVELGMTEMSVTKAWMHFRNPAGLVYSCRRHKDNYEKLDALLQFEGHSIVLPKGVSKATQLASVFTSDKAGDNLVRIRLSEGRLRILGQGVSGWYKEIKKADYQGPPLSFQIAPALLQHVCDRYQEAIITDRKLKVEGGHWTYVTVLALAEENDSPAPKKKKKGGDANEVKSERKNKNRVGK